MEGKKERKSGQGIKGDSAQKIGLYRNLALMERHTSLLPASSSGSVCDGGGTGATS